MAAIMTKRGSQDNVVTYEHICDTRADMASIEDRYITLGSTCIILKGTSGGMEVYIADSSHQWQSLAIAGGSSSGSGGTVIVNSSPLFHVCTSNEVRVNGTPKITSPEENTIYLVPANGKTNNLFNEYLYVNGKWEMIGSAGIDLSEYATYEDLNRANYAIRDELNNYASLDKNGQVRAEQLPIPVISNDDNDKILKVKNGDWSVENEIDISEKVDKTYKIDFEPKIWQRLTYFFGRHIWTDGDNIYYSVQTSHYVLDKSTSTWNTKTWNGLTNFYGSNIWTDGDNVYYSDNEEQYVLDKSTSTWNTKTWNGISNFSTNGIWTDGENIYYSAETNQLVLDKSTSTWNTKIWNGLTNFYGNNIWTDGDNIYYNYYQYKYVLNKATSTWSAKTWNGIAINFNGEDIWTDGENIYYSAETNQYVLDKSTSTWNKKIWDELTNFYARDIWTDGDNVYYNYQAKQYVLPVKEKKLLIGIKGEFNSVINVKDIFNNCGSMENPNFTGSISLGRKDGAVVGKNSIALGFNTTASGSGAHAEGRNTVADGYYSHAEGAGLSTNKVIEGITYTNTGAWGYSAHSEGETGYAIGEASHNEGMNTIAAGQASHAGGAYTEAIGDYSCVQGYSTIATGSCMNVLGSYNVDNGPEYTIWNITTSYADGDLVKYSNSLYRSLRENTGSAPNVAPGYWQQQSFDQVKGLYIEIVGNGISDTSRSNARALDWNGNEYLNGDLYVGCKANSTGGTKVATVDDIPLIKTYPNNIKTRSLGNVNINNQNLFMRDHSYFDFSNFQSGPAILIIGELTYNINGIFTSQADGTAPAGIENQYYSQELNNDGSDNLIRMIQYSGETTVTIDVYTPDSSITPSSKTASLTFISDYKLTSTTNAIYLNTEADGTGGEKVATEAYVDARIPTPPTTNGTYTLQVTVTDGTPTYSWV